MLDPALAERIGKPIFDALEQRGFEDLTAVQHAVIASEYRTRDLRISSKTGSGKTVAMGLLVRDELGDTEAGPRVLVITPTRELAKQVEDELTWLFASQKVGVASVTGGSGAAGYKTERRALSLKPAIVVGTPGRVLDHLERGVLVGANLAAVILDEADRMLDMGFREDVERIFSQTPPERRTHLVSATFPPEVRRLADSIQKDPQRIEGTPLGSANEDIDHLIHMIVGPERLSAIINLLLTTPGEPVLIFAKMRTDVSALTSDLRDAGFLIGKLSGEMDQHDRNRALMAFKRGQLDALVATDVAARGIDVQGIARVIHAEPPLDPEAYIHRSGRTGRAGNKGKSSILVTAGELPKTDRLLARARVRYSFEPVPTADAIRGHRDAVFIRALEEAPAEPHNEAVLKLAEQVLALGDAKLAVANLLERARALGPTDPRPITAVTPPDKRLREDPRGARERRAAMGPSLDSRTPDQKFEQFRVSWGQEHGAETRRLVAMLCRRGNIESRFIGAIRVARTFSTVEVDTAVSAGFAEQAGLADPRDPRITIRRFFDRKPDDFDQAPAAEPPARRDFTPRGDGPPRRDFTPRGDGPPRKDFAPRGDGPPRKDFAPRGDGPPRKDFAPRGDGPPRKDFAPRGDGPPRKDAAARTAKGEGAPAFKPRTGPKGGPKKPTPHAIKKPHRGK